LTVTEAPSPRILDWEGCYNVRDLGGLITSDGHRVRWGALVRSDIPTRLTERGRAALVAHGIRSIVDLRFAPEIADDGESYPFRGSTEATGPTYRNVPFHEWSDSPDEERIAAYRSAATRAELNRLDLDLNAPGIAAAVGAVADAPEGGVLVHCHAGKDRTGVVVALILALLGVSDEDIADDYALTSLTLEPLIAEWLDSQSDDHAERARLRALATPAREAMLDTLQHLRTRYGSAERYLLGAGASREQLERLHERLLATAH
jgi:protein-tyrosine phosphatase